MLLCQQLFGSRESGRLLGRMSEPFAKRFNFKGRASWAKGEVSELRGVI